MNRFNALPMLKTHCPICLVGPRIDCSDMKRCPLVLATYKGEYLTPEEFASLHKVPYTPSAVAPQPAIEPQCSNCLAGASGCQKSSKGCPLCELPLEDPDIPQQPATNQAGQFSLF